MEPSGTGRMISLKPKLIRRRRPSWVVVDEKQIRVDCEKKWPYPTVDTESKLLLEINVYSRRGICPAAAFFHHLTETHDVSDVGFLVDGVDYLTALFRHNLSGQLNYTEQNHNKNGSRRCRCGSNSFTRSGEAVNPSNVGGYAGLDTYISTVARTKR